MKLGRTFLTALLLLLPVSGVSAQGQAGMELPHGVYTRGNGSQSITIGPNHSITIQQPTRNDPMITTGTYHAEPIANNGARVTFTTSGDYTMNNGQTNTMTITGDMTFATAGVPGAGGAGVLSGTFTYDGGPNHDTYVYEFTFMAGLDQLET